MAQEIGLRRGAIGDLIACMPISALPWDCAAILGALAVLPIWRGTSRVRQFLARQEVSPSDRAVMYRSTMAFQWVAVGITLWRVRAHHWSAAELGLIPGKPAATVAAAAGLTIGLALLQVFGLRHLARDPTVRQSVPYRMMRRLMPQSSAELPVFAALLVTVSVCEEFLYRGFALAAFERIFRGSAVAAVAAAAVIFAMGHVYQGRQGSINTFVLGLLFGTARVWTGSMLPGVVSHFVTDAIAGIAGPRLVQRALEEGGGGPD